MRCGKVTQGGPSSMAATWPAHVPGTPRRVAARLTHHQLSTAQQCSACTSQQSTQSLLTGRLHTWRSRTSMHMQLCIQLALRAILNSLGGCTPGAAGPARCSCSCAPAGCGLKWKGRKEDNTARVGTLTPGRLQCLDAMCTCCTCSPAEMETLQEPSQPTHGVDLVPLPAQDLVVQRELKSGRGGCSDEGRSTGTKGC
jgi:hypothetical protein